MAARWDGDERGTGIADAAQLVAGVSELIAAFRQPTWVAEQPELHLLPHVQAWCQQDGRLSLTSSHTDETDTYVLELQWQGGNANMRAARAAVFSLIGSFAESATYVHQRRVARGGDGNGEAVKLRFEVGTGELAPDTTFAPHGHVVLISVAGAM